MIGDAIATGLVNLGGFGLLVWLRWSFRGEGPRSFHLHVDARGRRLFLGGATAGAAAMAFYAAAVLLSGRGSFVVGDARAGETLAAAAVWAVGFLGVALAEEALFRGLLLDWLAARAPLGVAIVLPSAIFGLIHLGSYAGSDAPWLGVLNAALFGVVLSMAVLAADSLMPAVGCHWAWNLVQLVLIPEGDDGTRLPIHLEVRGRLWPGAGALPESDLAVTIFLVVAGLAVAAWWRRAARSPARAG